MKTRTLRPRPFDNKKKLTVIHDAAGLELNGATVVSSIANKNAELEKNNDKVVTIAAKNGETMVPVPGFQQVLQYGRLYPNDFVLQDDVNFEYLNSGRTVLPGDTSPVEYAADASDEDWLSSTINTEGQDRLSVSNFEKMIWRLELANSMITQHLLRKEGASTTERKLKGTNYAMQNLTKIAAMKLLNKHEGIDLNVIEQVYDYWIQKRQNLKMPLLRTLQPKTAANDRNPDHTFREREKVKRPNTRRRRHIGRADNAEEKLAEIKDEMGHVCNIFKSMVNRESMKAHVVNLYIAEKRTLLDQLFVQDTGQSSKAKKICKEQEKKEQYLKKDDAEYRAKMSRFLLQNVFCGQLQKMLVCSRGFEADGDAEMILSRRLRRAQKRRQKVISILVQDRNWQKWRDTTWMHQMFLMLKKRSIYNEIAKTKNQRKLWKKWEKFVKLTRDERVKQLTDGNSRKKPTANNASKQKKSSKIKDSSEADTSQPKTANKKPSKKGSSKSSGQGEESTNTDGVLVNEISKGTLKWALEQGINSPEEEGTVSREITIPQNMIAPQMGFPCLPPRLKEMYSEAERDAIISSNCTVHKKEELKIRRQRILQLMNDSSISRSDAIAQCEKETKHKMQIRKQNQRKTKLGKSICASHSDGKLQENAEQICTALVAKLSQNMNSTGETSLLDSKMDPSIVSEEVNFRCRKKGLKLCKGKIYKLKQSMMNCESKSHLHQKGLELHHWLVQFWKLKFHKSQFLYKKRRLQNKTGTNQEQANYDTRLNQSKKRVTLIKRCSHRFILELRSQGHQREIPLDPGSHLPLTPFQGNRLDPSQIQDYLNKPESSTPLQVEGLVKKTNEAESKQRRITVGLSASRRLLEGKCVASSTLLKRHRLRRMMLNPLLSQSMKNVPIAETKLRKLGAIHEMKMDVPKPPEVKPLFSYTFKVGKSKEDSKTNINTKLFAGVSDEILSSGIARIGRGNRVWIDRANPLTGEKSIKSSSSHSMASFQELPVLQRVLEGDQFKKQLICKHNEDQKRIRHETEEEDLKKAAVAHESNMEVIRRQSNFLPYWSAPISTQNALQETKQHVSKLKGSPNRLKEAQRIQGTVAELGVKLPIRNIYDAMDGLYHNSPNASSPGLDEESFEALDRLMDETAPPRLTYCRIEAPESSNKRRRVGEGIVIKSEPNDEDVGWISSSPMTRSSLPNIKIENSETSFSEFERLIMSAPRKPRSNVELPMQTNHSTDDADKEAKRGPTTRSQSNVIRNC